MNVQLTPEQQEQVRQAKAAGERRATMVFTPEQYDQWRAAFAQEFADKEENVAHFRKIKSAAEQPGFFGDLRRAIVLAKRPPSELANAIGVDERRFSNSRAGEAELPSEALDRLIGILGLRLMREISR